MARKITKKQLEKDKKNHKLRIKTKKAARRSGKTSQDESKIKESRSKGNLQISQKRRAAIKKSRY